jgi:hypothetical protein
LKFAPLAATSPIASSGSSKKFMLDNNSLGAKSVTFNFNNNGTGELIAAYDQGDRKLTFGLNKWEKDKNGIMLNAQLPFPVTSLPNVASPVAANATWQDANTLYLDIRPVETVTGDSITCIFTGNSVKLTFLNTVAKGGKEQEKRPVLTGKLT